MSTTQPFQNPPPFKNTSTPKFVLPKNATDCHCHLFDDLKKYPFTEKPSYLPPSVFVEDYLKASLFHPLKCNMFYYTLATYKLV